MMRRPWIVLKFGGTSVARAERWRTIAEQIDKLRPTHRVWVVVSALAGVSNALERAIEQALSNAEPAAQREIHERHAALAADLGLDVLPVEVGERLGQLDTWLTGVGLTGEAPPRLRARILAVGELASSRLGAAALCTHGIDAKVVDARRLLTSDARPTDADELRFLEATVAVVRDPARAEAEVGETDVVLTQGFIARTADDETCLLGRGGSDTSAALFAALLGASELQIWTDVHGMFTADPGLVPMARMIRQVGYREAQELAAMGAKVLHPRCIEPVFRHGIPLTVHSIEQPDQTGTRVEATDEQHPAVTAVTCRTGVTLISLATLEMWRVPGFLARVFQSFEELGFSIDLVATSQSAVSVTLDRVPGGVRGTAFCRLIERLEKLGRVTVVHPSGVVSIVGRRIRAALHELGPSLAVFQERPVYLVSDSTEDLNLSFVVDERDAAYLVARLHEHLFPAQGGDERFGPTWEMLEGRREGATPSSCWWRSARERLLELTRDDPARYVYHLPTVVANARALSTTLRSIDRVYYSSKANPHPRILQAVVEEGLGIECVSAAEVRHARDVLGDGVPLLFTPNFCPLEEYAAAFAAGAEVVVDGPEPLLRAPEIFRDRAIGLRVDPGKGVGHHDLVKTAGAQAKFGQPLSEIARLVPAAAAAGARIVGLHAHVGSGILDALAWAATGRTLASLLDALPDLEWIDLGGGLGVPERPGQVPLDLELLEHSLSELREGLAGIALRIEPGRFLVSEAGVLLARVTQVRAKGGVRFIGLGTGMNSLIRPALYGAWHGIHNLTRLDEPTTGYWNVVGPICETADILGRDRLLPETRPDDVLLIENAGAYGAVMASRYNLREPAGETILD